MDPDRLAMVIAVGVSVVAVFFLACLWMQRGDQGRRPTRACFTCSCAALPAHTLYTRTLLPTRALPALTLLAPPVRSTPQTRCRPLACAQPFPCPRAPHVHLACSLPVRAAAAIISAAATVAAAKRTAATPACSAAGAKCQRSTGDPRLILGKGYRHVVLGGYGRSDPLLNKPFYSSGLMTGILTCRAALPSRAAQPEPRCPDRARCPALLLLLLSATRTATSGGAAGGGGGPRGGQLQLSSQQLREWAVRRGSSGGPARCGYIRRTGHPGAACTRTDHPESRCFFHLDDLYRPEHGEQMKTPDWLALLKKDIDVFACVWDVIHAGMHAIYVASASVEGDCYSCEPRVARVEAASLGAFDSDSTCAEPEEALHTFTLDSGASRCFFCDSTAVTPLTVPVLVTLADPSRGPIVARGATVLPCPVAPSGLLTGLHLPSFAKNLLATSDLQDQWVTITQPGEELVAICTDARSGEHLATFTRRRGSGLYTMTTESALTLLWHHRLGHPSLPRLRGMDSRLLASGLPRSLPPFPRSLAPPCLPCVEGRQRAAPHSSSFPPTTAPPQTLHVDVWGPARVPGQGGER
ncbi:unnamed protein product [Closterium sp. NIES-54]